ncbi:YihY/virulence factor BrkB family protein [Sphingomonas naphthae]|uniref:YihY/virulence factor BrkB family protein n=1 Tax=Sphingomonas naphthae TaxID=1813468 RepID=A0ABY7TKF9_9SPHN|nr:YihY/virulence factor BrkB family protein [Sphingomonas naphthae]WCT73528.1 YihY/virulence factor BrkB family protein [Sphingomonas naphthae]
MQRISPESPEERAAHPLWRRSLRRLRPTRRVMEVVKRVAIGVYSDGFIHAGNLAYLALVSLFPFFIVLAALAQAFDRGPDTAAAIASFLRTLPPTVANLLRQPIADVLANRTGALLWLGALVGFWTVGSFIETIRDILRRAYGTQFSRAFWHYRLGSVAIIFVSVVAVLTAFSAQVVLTGAEQFIYRLLPFTTRIGAVINVLRLPTLLLLTGSIYLVFLTLTPAKYRYAGCPKWPGALFTSVWWMAITMALPAALSLLGGYDRTYGSLAGVVIALFFFWLVGFGLVIGAHLNAALAETPEARLRGSAPEARE